MFARYRCTEVAPCAVMRGTTKLRHQTITAVDDACTTMGASTGLNPGETT